MTFMRAFLYRATVSLVLIALLLLAGRTRAQQAGQLVTIDVESDDEDREFELYTPVGWTPGSGPIPLVLNWHGWSNTPADLIERAMDSAEADEYGWAIAYPAALSGNSFAAGVACCPPATILGVDDVQFARDIVEAADDLLNVDTDAVFSMGYSNGAFMSHLIACEAPDLVRAIAPNAGRLNSRNFRCRPGGSIPVISFQGDADSIVTIDGTFAGLVSETISSYQEDLENRLDENNCDPDVVQTLQVTPTSTCELYTDCDGEGFVEYCTIAGGEHEWFNGPDDIDTSAYAFMRFSQILDGTYPGGPNEGGTTTEATTTTTEATTTVTTTEGTTTTTTEGATTTTDAGSTTTEAATVTSSLESTSDSSSVSDSSAAASGTAASGSSSGVVAAVVVIVLLLVAVIAGYMLWKRRENRKAINLSITQHQQYPMAPAMGSVPGGFSAGGGARSSPALVPYTGPMDADERFV